MTFDWATADYTALAGSDYVAASDSAVIPAGETWLELAVDVMGDSDPEYDESFDIVITNVDGAHYDPELATTCPRPSMTTMEPLVCHRRLR